MKSLFRISSVVLVLLLIISYLFPIGNLFYKNFKTYNYKVTVSMVNGTNRTFYFNDLKGLSLFADSHKGSYYINIIEDGINIFGKKSPIGINKGVINGGLYVINVEKY